MPAGRSARVGKTRCGKTMRTIVYFFPFARHPSEQYNIEEAVGCPCAFEAQRSSSSGLISHRHGLTGGCSLTMSMEESGRVLWRVRAAPLVWFRVVPASVAAVSVEFRQLLNGVHTVVRG